MTLGDLVLTFIGQGRHYWAGAWDEPNEASPWFHYFLRRHPLAATAAGVAWVLILSVLIWVLPRRLSLWVWLAVVMGHTWGMSTWVRILWPDPSYWICLALWIGVAGLTAWSWDGDDRARVTSGVEIARRSGDPGRRVAPPAA